MLGVDRKLLPTREAWRAVYEEDYARPLRERVNYSLVWRRHGQVVGFSSTDRIDFGHQAFMHLHVVEPELRNGGLGTEFVRLSAQAYFTALELERLFGEPNAFNVAPNRTLQRAGFRYLFTHEAQPSSINYPQSTTRWVLDRSNPVTGQAIPEWPFLRPSWRDSASHLDTFAIVRGDLLFCHD